MSAIKDKVSIKTNTCANTYNIQALLSLSDMYKEIEKMFLKDEGNKVLEYIIRSVNYINGMALSFYCMNTPKDDLETSIDTLREIYLKNEIKTKEDLIEFLKYVENLDEKAKKIQIPDNDKSVEAVQLTTIHSAKGLEFPYVFILGMVEDVFPSFRLKENPLDLEEERRLCYVAVTRAKKKLYLCTYDFLITEKGIATTKPSRFIDELNTNFDIL